MSTLCRMPAYPLAVNDPYFSIWSAVDEPTLANTTHWTGAEKPICICAEYEGASYRLMGLGEEPALPVCDRQVTPLATSYAYAVPGAILGIRFWSPALPQEPDLFSIPATFVEFCVQSTDGAPHSAKFTLSVSDRMAYDGDAVPEMHAMTYSRDGLHFAFTGQTRQKLLCHSADHVTIDWGYLYLAGRGEVSAHDHALWATVAADSAPGSPRAHVTLAYDDVASILYFGSPCKAWYARNGKSLPDAICELERDYAALAGTVAAMDEEVLAEAREIGGEDYALIVSAAWRLTLGAHKLIATPKGEMALLSKENDSNGCIGTVDLSYPSAPFFLKYNPELVNAMCRPILEFAEMPVWKYPFAPHDVGRYPIVNGQVYAYRDKNRADIRMQVYPPIYLYPESASEETYDPRYQMPLEESGNMIVMLAAAYKKTGDATLIRRYGDVIRQWVRYLVDYGAEPEDQLCTDDFAGHLSQNVNLSAKAVMGLACYSEIASLCGDPREALWMGLARARAQYWYFRNAPGMTPLTFEGTGWSMKYNLAWDRALGLGLISKQFYEEELPGYLEHMNEYGLPLDSRKTYTKSDWILWTASMAKGTEVFSKIIAPVAKFIRETPSRVPFSDWYDTVTGEYVHFIGRSVQGGVFMPML